MNDYTTRPPAYFQIFVIIKIKVFSNYISNAFKVTRFCNI